MKLYRVGTFPAGKTGKNYTAYTRWYNPEWPGCVEYDIYAESGTAAKKDAIRRRKAADAPKE